MPTTYAYKVRDTAGREIHGSLDADNSDLVAGRLREMGYVPISIAKKSASLKSEISIPGLSNRIDGRDIALFSREFATLTGAGVSLTRALATMAAQMHNPRFAGVVNQVRADVEAGSSLSQGLAKHPKQFNRLYVSMIRAGETGGSLDRTLNDLSTTLEKEVELRRKVKSAMTYPIAVLALVVVILTAMLVFVVPIFKKMYKQLGGALPTPTRILVGISDLAVRALPLLVVAAIVAAVFLRRWIGTPRGRAVADRLVMRVPIFGGLVRNTSLARFASTLSTLMSSGVPVLEALDITVGTSGNSLVADGIRSIAEGTRQGQPMARSLEGHAVFPPMMTQMIAVGEETGALDMLLAKVALFYEQEVQATVDALTSLLEPLMIVVLGGAVGATVISLYLPMFDIYKLVGKSG